MDKEVKVAGVVAAIVSPVKRNSETDRSGLIM